ncbi:hypothetical protein PIB30_057254 [Stylosanthes scabra]|uniref:Uncharacterized protein n=1 Tax=Stylosanthes scabra TaxID=79078 RepID=A0ABU6VI70_9FABA|nr:hypothetical protein [Stylosanthes scabra]
MSSTMLGAAALPLGVVAGRIHMGALQRAQIKQGLGKFHTGVVVVCDLFFGLGQRLTQRDPSLDAQIIIQLGRGGVASLCRQIVKKKMT